MTTLGIGSLQAATIYGALFQITSSNVILREIRVDRYVPYKNQDTSLSILRIDYQGAIGDIELFVREGVGVDMLDPTTPTAKVTRLVERSAGNYHIYEVICVEGGVFTCGVLIEAKVTGVPNPETRGAGVYVAVRGSDPKQLAAALSLILDEIHLGLSGRIFERVGATDMAVGFKELVEVLVRSGEVGT